MALLIVTKLKKSDRWLCDLWLMLFDPCDITMLFVWCKPDERIAHWQWVIERHKLFISIFGDLLLFCKSTTPRVAWKTLLTSDFNSSLSQAVHTFDFKLKKTNFSGEQKKTTRLRVIEMHITTFVYK